MIAPQPSTYSADFRRATARWLAAGALITLVPAVSALHAQRVGEATLAVGQRVRLVTRDSIPHRHAGIVLELSTDSVVVQERFYPDVYRGTAVAFSDIRSLEVSHGTPFIARTLIGFLYGGVIGVSAGAAVGLMATSDASSPGLPASEQLLYSGLAAAYGAILGATTGAILGALTAREHWRATPVGDGPLHQ